MRLQTYHPFRPLYSVAVSIGLTLLISRFYDKVGITKGPWFVTICTALLITGIVCALLNRTSTLNVDERSLSIEKRLYNQVISREVYPLSSYEWIRARRSEDWREFIVEAGNSGFETLELLKQPLGSQTDIQQARDLCEKISSTLQLQNWGYKEVS